MGFKKQSISDFGKEEVVELPSKGEQQQDNNTTIDEAKAEGLFYDNGASVSTTQVAELPSDGNPGSNPPVQVPASSGDEVKNTGLPSSRSTNVNELAQQAPAPEQSAPADWIKSYLDEARHKYTEDVEAAQKKAKTRQKLQVYGDMFKLIGEMAGVSQGGAVEKRDNPYLNKALSGPDRLDAELRDYNRQLTNTGLSMGYDALNRDIERKRRQSEFDQSLAQQKELASQRNKMFEDEMAYKRGRDEKQDSMQSEQNAFRNKLAQQQANTSQYQAETQRQVSESTIKANEALAKQREAQALASKLKAASGKTSGLNGEWAAEGVKDAIQLDDKAVQWLYDKALRDGIIDVNDAVNLDLVNTPEKELKGLVIQRMLNTLASDPKFKGNAKAIQAWIDAKGFEDAPEHLEVPQSSEENMFNSLFE